MYFSSEISSEIRGGRWSPPCCPAFFRSLPSISAWPMERTPREALVSRLRSARELFSLGIDLLTSGNHVWDKKEIEAYIQGEPRLLRPANYPPGVPGSGVHILRKNEYCLGVLNLSGRTFMADSRLSLSGGRSGRWRVSKEATPF